MPAYYRLRRSKPIVDQMLPLSRTFHEMHEPVGRLATSRSDYSHY